jgi:hypothetical protein
VLYTETIDIKHTLCCAAKEIQIQKDKCDCSKVLYLTLNVSLFHFSIPFMLGTL